MWQSWRTHMTLNPLESNSVRMPYQRFYSYLPEPHYLALHAIANVDSQLCSPPNLQGMDTNLCVTHIKTSNLDSPVTFGLCTHVNIDGNNGITNLWITVKLQFCHLNYHIWHVKLLTCSKWIYMSLRYQTLRELFRLMHDNLSLPTTIR